MNILLNIDFLRDWLHLRGDKEHKIDLPRVAHMESDPGLCPTSEYFFILSMIHLLRLLQIIQHEPYYMIQNSHNVAAT